MKLFIDTNVLLSFYHLTSEDIEELKKLIALIDSKQVMLLMPSHVEEEFHRNREGKIIDALKRLKETKFDMSFPAFCRDYSHYKELRKLLAQANAKHAELVKTITDDANQKSLNADSIIEKLFAKANKIEVTDKIYNAAVKRVDLGNPPGKKGSLGDAVNWECLLAAVDDLDTDDTYIISSDADYVSKLSEGDIHPYLEREWDKAKASCVFLFRQLSDFFKEQFPTIKLASEVQANLVIHELATSGNFAKTHSVIAKLDKLEFSLPQVEQLISIPDINSQVGWIISDSDVHHFYSKLHSAYGDQLPEEQRKKLEELVALGLPDGVVEDGV